MLYLAKSSDYESLGGSLNFSLQQHVTTFLKGVNQSRFKIINMKLTKTKAKPRAVIARSCL